jgi:hypothetical protein
LVWTKTAYKSYQDCFEKVLKPKNIKIKSSESQAKIDDFFNKGGYDFLKRIENDFDCAGLCEVPLFYISKDISKGRPTTECISVSFDKISEGISIIGYIVLVTGLFTFAGFVGSFALCTKDKE